MTHRRGTTLIEVLVSIFVMAIGMIALLALFPLGAFQMADAIKDDRVSACVANATSVATAWSLRHDLTFTITPSPAFDKPSPKHVDVSAGPWLTGPSYAVYADPVGRATYFGSTEYVDWVAAVGIKTFPGQAGLKRVGTSFAPNGPSALRWCTFLDDINFDKNGAPATPAGSVERT